MKVHGHEHEGCDKLEVDPHDKANELARALANGPAVALGLIRRLYWESPHNSYEQ